MSGTAVAGRIGPNAVIRLAEALDACEGRAVTAKLFRTAGLEHYVGAPPQSMVAEDEVTVLHRHLHEALPSARARTVSWIAGQRTAEYLLANRIPQPMQRLLKILPRRLSAFILLTAIGKHAWTFAGSARFTWRLGHPISFALADCPLCRNAQADAPCCDYYAATFEALFRRLIDSRTSVTETACTAAGAPACRFQIVHDRAR
jgi:divinyl protochlorophyllide a 8-vinyl-reductase